MDVVIDEELDRDEKLSTFLENLTREINDDHLRKHFEQFDTQPHQL